MKNKFWVGVVLFGFWAASCAALMMTGEEKYGKSVPVITEVFASQQLRPGDPWKVYRKLLTRMAICGTSPRSSISQGGETILSVAPESGEKMGRSWMVTCI